MPPATPPLAPGSPPIVGTNPAATYTPGSSSPFYDTKGNITGYVKVGSGGSSSFLPQPGSTPVVEPTVLSSANIDTTNTLNQGKIQNYPAAGQIVAGDGLVRNADQSFAEAPSDATGTIGDNGQQTWSSGGLTYALGPAGGKISSDPAIQTIYDQFTSLKAQMDATGAANIANIQAAYGALIESQKQSNASSEASTYSLLARGGSLQTESSGGIIHAQVSDGLAKIADLNNKEQSAIIGAQQAMQSGDMQLLDKQLSIAQQARTEQQAAASKLSDSIIAAKQKVIDQQQAAAKDTAVQAVLATGVTDPAAILKTLRDQGYTTISAQDIASTVASLNPDAKEVHAMLLNAAQNGAPQSVLAAIAKAKSLGDAVGAAGRYVTDPTSLAGQFQAAVAAGYKGTPGDWVAAQKYKEAYAAASAAQLAKNNITGSDAVQQKLEQEGRAVILKEVSNRSGGLGLQDAKVNQAIHLRALFDQYKTTKVVPNTGSAGQTIAGTHTETTYNIPASQYTEVAMGLASLISPTSVVAEGTINKITQSTARGDINAAITYATGSPQSGSTQAVFQNLRDSIDRQGGVAEQERQRYIDNLAALLPTDLNADRRAALLAGSSLNSYTNPTPAQMTPAQIDSDAFSKIQSWASSNPQNAALLTELSTQFPNLSNVELAQKLKLIK